MAAMTTYLSKRDLNNNYRCDLKWFLVFTIVDATFFQLFLTYGIAKTGAGLGSVLIDFSASFGGDFSKSNFWEFN